MTFRVGRLTLLMVVIFGATSAHAIVVSSEVNISIRADFVFSPGSNWVLPILGVDHGVDFASSNALNLGEAYRVRTFDSAGTLLSSSEFQNLRFSNIIGCACTGGALDPDLAGFAGFLLLDAMIGSFDVTNITMVGFGTRYVDGVTYPGLTRPTGNAAITNIRACSEFPGGGTTQGCFRGPGPFPAPEPGTLALLGLGLLGLGVTQRKSA